MGQAWRMVKEKYAASAFSGEGASRSGGRWNSQGVWMVYASGSRALAALETLVHLNPPIHFHYRIFRIEFDDEIVEKMDWATLPSNWTDEPPPPSTKDIGDLWVKEGRSAVLELPSAIMPGEPNYLLNPAHPDFGNVVIGTPESFSFDRRLLE